MPGRGDISLVLLATKLLPDVRALTLLLAPLPKHPSQCPDATYSTMASINAPVSIADVVAQAANYTYNAQIPLSSWLRTASTMQKEVRCPHVSTA